MINMEMELDAALARVVELEDERETLLDALTAMNNSLPGLLEERDSLYRRVTELEEMLRSKVAG